MLTDAHIHFPNLAERDPGFPERFAGSGILACASAHDADEHRYLESLAACGLRFIKSFGIHPQWVVYEHADLLERLAAGGELAAIGEAGFDFFGDRPERLRTAENEKAQAGAFEFQLELAERLGLPLLMHVRRGYDLVFSYRRRLARLPAVIFHSYSGTIGEAESLLKRGVEAYFSFGTSILNGHKRCIEAARQLPGSRILTETDAPWQPPRGSNFCRFEDIGLVLQGLAAIREVPREEAELAVSTNFLKAYRGAKP